MICPYCGKEMEDGYLQSGRPILWSAEKKKDVIAASEEDIRISSGFWRGCYVAASLCRSCGKLIMDVEEKA